MKRPPLPPTLRCECEHEDHFPRTRGTSVDGQPKLVTKLDGHAYGIEFPAQHIAAVHTPFGRVPACPACREVCLGQYEVTT